MTGLADCNNFFVSCERAQNPQLEGRAVVVLSNNDGCAVARSNEAKRLGVKMGQPAFELRELITSEQLIALSGNHTLYRDISLRIHDIFRRYAPDTTDYSVDEAFLDMTGIPDSELPGIGAAIVKTCMEEERIPVTIGFAATKTLAKIATERGKKAGERVVMLTDQEEIGKILSDMPIGDLWGIGRRLAKRMYLAGVHTIRDFARKELIWVRGELGVHGERSWRELHGEPCIELAHASRTLQESVSETRTFPTDIGDFDYIRSRIVIYSTDVARRLRAMKGVCGVVSVFMATNRFHRERGYITPSASVRLDPPTSDTNVIADTAVRISESIFDPAYRYKRAGVTLSEIIPEREAAPSLFEDMEARRLAAARSRRLMEAVDRLNRDCGSNVLGLATRLDKGYNESNDRYVNSFGPAKKY